MSELINIPLNKLEVAPENVRTMPAGEAADAEMKASIAAHGLQQNLVVRPDGDGYAVIAGGRRLVALRALAGDGEIAADFGVPCAVVGEAVAATEISLAENAVRIAMHPADQIVAFAKLADAGSAAADIAVRFGVSERLVEQRLRLAGVAPVILDAYRDGALDLETLKAFAVTSDHARQTAVWADVGEGAVRPAAWQVRRLISEGRVPGDSALARFVGIDAYEAAGGAVDRDLFADGDDGRGVWIKDESLLNGLALTKMRATADELAKRWKWAEPEVEVDWSAMARYGRIYPEPSEPTSEERAETDRLHERMRELMDTDEEDWTDALAEEAHGIEVRLAEIEQEIDGRAKYRDEDYAIAGAIVSIDREGELVIYDGLVRPEDMPGDEPKPSGEEGDRLRDPAITGGAQGNPEAEARKEAGVSAGLADDLRAIRTTIVKAHIERDFDAAFDLLLFQVARSVFSYSHGKGALDLTAAAPGLRPLSRLSDPNFAEWSLAEKQMEDTEWLALSWLESQDDAAAFEALRNLPAGEKRDLFAACVARMVKGQLSFEAGARPEFEATADRLQINFSVHVRSSADLLWSRLSKGKMLDIAARHLGDEWTKQHAKLKKGDLAAEMEKAFTGPDAPDYAPPGFAAFDDEEG